MLSKPRQQHTLSSHHNNNKKEPIQSKRKTERQKEVHSHQMAHGGARTPQSWRPSKKHFHFSLLNRTHSLYTWEMTKSSCRRIRWLLTDMMTKTQHTHGDRHTPSTDRVHRIGSWQLGFAFGVVMGIKYTVKTPYSWSWFVWFQTVCDNQALIPPNMQ